MLWRAGLTKGPIAFTYPGILLLDADWWWWWVREEARRWRGVGGSWQREGRRLGSRKWIEVDGEVGVKEKGNGRLEKCKES